MCHGLCDMNKNNGKWKIPSSHQMPYTTHGYCRNCSFWVLKDEAWHKVRCPCCHGRMSFRPRKGKNVGH